MTIKIGILGAGRWGMNHVRTAAGLVKGEMILVCEENETQREKVREISGDIRITGDFEEFLKSDVNAVINALPAEMHFDTTKRCLEAGMNVLVEKPMTLQSRESEMLTKIADDKNLKLMVGHILLYHPAVIKLKALIDEGKIGRLQYIYSNRLNLGAIRSEENILWSFAPHDISIMQYITGSNPVSVAAKGSSFVQKGIEDTTLTYLEYPEGVSAHIFVSWLHPFKEQRLVVTGDKGMLVFEDSLKTEKLKFYNKGFKVVNGSPEKFDRDYEAVEFGNAKPLEEE
ncbi:MAG TPA: Gfo/Idh/MocA family oxidoreductase, partial [Ignavibacteria bacterium]|nr:Gfo/Idh/MocA family oxidoreductase [Ignavibacteria bacterium]